MEVDTISRAIEELRGEVTRQRDEISFLRSLILDRFPVSHTPSRPKPSLPDPEKFSGSSQKFDTWLPSIRAKLQVDGAAIGDSTAQFYYVYLNLESHVQAMVLPQLSSLDQNVPLDHTTILDQLTRVYNNPNKVQEAEDRLFNLKQGTDSLHAYIAKFERTLYEAKGQNWPDSNKISTFRNGLNTTLRNRLSQQLSLPRSYPDFVQVMQQLAARTANGFPAPSHSNEPRAPHILQNPSHSRNHDPMDVSNLNVIGAFDPLDTQADPTPIPPRPRAPEFSPAERTLLRKQNKCVRCGSAFHWVRSCPLDPHQGARDRKEPVPAVTITPADFEYDDDEGEDLGEIINGRYFEDRLEEADNSRDAFHLAAMHLAHQGFLLKNDKENGDIDSEEEDY
ncbi:hypothetical protein EAE99_002322 [Botrytis elliptica]|nr:hypothetical protein EAE99_011990 [Botrytis elliptica]KAF7917305.1 hypothetical protein EAE99_009316 [Botrytis elliptica]KAF7918291.1 hypothetical protein EAE99_008887 [Botrytis elliptica]KAF7922937.1 hypothetical protein EAE99_007129 [Botrytis elliptica]KAF7924086.1 hypothetical protein EAE99_006747 [Botrytis elliptica]